MKPLERSQLIDDLIAGEISESDFLRIEAEMSVDAEVRQEFYRRLQLEEVMEQEAGVLEPCVTQSIDTSRSADRPGSISQGHWWVALLIGMAATWLAFLILPEWRKPSTISAVTNESPDSSGPDSVVTGSEARGPSVLEFAEQSAIGFGLLSGQSDAVWGNVPIRTGSLLTDREMHLKSGLARLELFSGVDIVVEGEARFRIDSPMQLTLHDGRTRARVPEPAQGFRIKTSSGDVVDLGTEFCVDASDASAEIKVVEGEIELHEISTNGRPATPQRLEPGRTLAWAPDGTLAELNEQDSRLSASVGPKEFEEITKRRHREKMKRWQQSSEDLRHDERLIALYQVDPVEAPSRRLINRSLAAKTLASEAAVVASDSVADRWGRDGGGLSFSPMGSRIRVNVPGEHPSLSMHCWVRINRLGRLYNSLFLTDGHEDREPHWQIMDDGRIFFSIKSPVPKRFGTESVASHMNVGQSQQYVFYSPPMDPSQFLSRWLMLAVTYDAENRSVVHYVDGEAVSQEAINEAYLVDSIHIGAASIGNWSEPMYRTDPTFVLRNLDGCMDEFAIFAGVLSADEIKRIFEEGKPIE